MFICDPAEKTGSFPLLLVVSAACPVFATLPCSVFTQCFTLVSPTFPTYFLLVFDVPLLHWWLSPHASLDSSYPLRRA